jgi:hypothetical protein
VLLGEIEGSEDVEYQRLCQQLLNRIPSDPVVVKSLRNMPEFIASLKNASKEPLFVYTLQVLKHRISNKVIRRAFQESEGPAFVLDTIRTRQTVFKGIGTMLVFFKDLELDDREWEAIIPKLLQFFPALKKHKQVVVEILIRVPWKGTLCNVLQHNQPLFEQMIGHLDEDSWNALSRLLYDLRNQY